MATRSQPLEMAEEAYRLRFGEFAPVWGFLEHPRLVDELLAEAG
jgi:hypothetical protein